MRLLIPLFAILVAASFSPAQESSQESEAKKSSWPLPEDVATPESVVQATYASINRAPGAPYQWERFRSLFLPEAKLIPAVRQTGGVFKPLSPKEFEDWISAAAPAGRPGDRGFAEEQVWSETRSYGTIASALSTYQKHFWEDERILGRGINSFQLVQHEDRWWITSLIWDEVADAGPIPAKFGGETEPETER